MPENCGYCAIPTDFAENSGQDNPENWDVNLPGQKFSVFPKLSQQPPHVDDGMAYFHNLLSENVLQ